jgi:hypothetical protein
MSRFCSLCHQDGLVFIRDLDSGGYIVCVCTCKRGEWWTTKWQLRAFIEALEPPPITGGRLEEFFTEEEIASLRPQPREHVVVDGKERVAL